MSLFKTKPSASTPEQVSILLEEYRAILAIEQLGSTSGRLDKESILRDNFEHELFKEILHFQLNPYIVTGLSSKKIIKPVAHSATRSFTTVSEVLIYLSDNSTGTDEVIANVRGFINSREEKLRNFYVKLFTKELKTGVGATTANKVYGEGFVPDFSVMLAKKYDDVAPLPAGTEFTLTLKLDGIRCIAIRKDNRVSFYSRQGQLIEGLVEIESDLLSLPDREFVLDGELLATSAGTSAEQYKETTKIVRKDGVKRGVTYHVFDCLSIKDFESRSCDQPYYVRRSALVKKFKYLESVLVLPELYSGVDTSQIPEILNLVIGQQKEGLMLNINDRPYVFGRTDALLKIKVMHEVDLEITGFEEGKGAFSGTLGCVFVDYKGHKVGVGSGFTLEDREYFWANREELLGRVITVQYFEETSNASEGLSLRFPVFIELREEGKEVNC